MPVRCPHCGSAERQVNNGFNRTGSRRLRCQPCRRDYTPDPHPPGYDGETRAAALRLYLEGHGVREVARALGVNHQTIANWLNLLLRQIREHRTTED